MNLTTSLGSSFLTSTSFFGTSFLSLEAPLFSESFTSLGLVLSSFVSLGGSCCEPSFVSPATGSF